MHHIAVIKKKKKTIAQAFLHTLEQVCVIENMRGSLKPEKLCTVQWNNNTELIKLI